MNLMIVMMMVMRHFVFDGGYTVQQHDHLCLTISSFAIPPSARVSFTLVYKYIYKYMYINGGQVATGSQYRAAGGRESATQTPSILLARKKYGWMSMMMMTGEGNREREEDNQEEEGGEEEEEEEDVHETMKQQLQQLQQQQQQRPAVVVDQEKLECHSHR